VRPRERTVARSTPGGDKWVAAFLRFPFFCLVVAFRKPEGFLVREGRTMVFGHRVVKVKDSEDGSVVVGVVRGRSGVVHFVYVWGM
jgi:hypothetical protein